MTSFYGIDLSMTGTGLASFDMGGEWDVATVSVPAEDRSPGAFIDRAETIAAKIIAWCDPHEGDVIAMEGPALQAKSSQLDRMFALWWFTYRALRDHHAEPHIIPPSVVKQLATGKGNANKDSVLIDTVKRVPRANVTNNNEADAVWLAVAAGHFDGAAILSLPVAHLTGLAKLMGPVKAS